MAMARSFPAFAIRIDGVDEEAPRYRYRRHAALCLTCKAWQMTTWVWAVGRLRCHSCFALEKISTGICPVVLVVGGRTTECLFLSSAAISWLIVFLPVRFLVSILAVRQAKSVDNVCFGWRVGQFERGESKDKSHCPMSIKHVWDALGGGPI